jgi:transcriptional regulator with XRE-family HTH domain
MKWKLSAKKLRRRRNDLGLTLQQVSELTEMDISTISQIELGKRTFTIRTAHTFAEALECSVHDFFETPL